METGIGGFPRRAHGGRRAVFYPHDTARLGSESAPRVLKLKMPVISEKVETTAPIPPAWRNPETGRYLAQTEKRELGYSAERAARHGRFTNRSDSGRKIGVSHRIDSAGGPDVLL